VALNIINNKPIGFSLLNNKPIGFSLLNNRHKLTWYLFLMFFLFYHSDLSRYVSDYSVTVSPRWVILLSQWFITLCLWLFYKPIGFSLLNNKPIGFSLLNNRHKLTWYLFLMFFLKMENSHICYCSTYK
jgi:predicted acetyltransferase